MTKIVGIVIANLNNLSGCGTPIVYKFNSNML